MRFAELLGEIVKRWPAIKGCPSMTNPTVLGSSWVTYWITWKLKINIEPLNAPLEKINANLQSTSFRGCMWKNETHLQTTSFAGCMLIIMSYTMQVYRSHEIWHQSNLLCTQKHVCISFHVYSLFPNHLPWSFPCRFPNQGSTEVYLRARMRLDAASAGRCSRPRALSQKKWKANLVGGFNSFEKY